MQVLNNDIIKYIKKMTTFFLTHFVLSLFIKSDLTISLIKG